MSGQANCFDNACVESFFATLKRERVYRRRYRSRAEARADLFDYIEVFYNRQRRHSLLGHRTGNRGKTKLARLRTVRASGCPLGGEQRLVREPPRASLRATLLSGAPSSPLMTANWMVRR